MLTATVSGSFHRHMEAINRAVHELAGLSVRVLSPADPRVVAAQGEFLFVASDRVRSVRIVQDRHLESIRVADFLWLVCPDGWVGQSGCMELGFAAAAHVPIYSTRVPNDLTMREYVTIVPSLADAVRRAETAPRQNRPAGLLIDPHASVEQAHRVLERLESLLTRTSTLDSRDIYHDIGALHANLRLPTLIQ